MIAITRLISDGLRPVISATSARFLLLPGGKGLGGVQHLHVAAVDVVLVVHRHRGLLERQRQQTGGVDPPGPPLAGRGHAVALARVGNLDRPAGGGDRVLRPQRRAGEHLPGEGLEITSGYPGRPQPGVDVARRDVDRDDPGQGLDVGPPPGVERRRRFRLGQLGADVAREICLGGEQLGGGRVLPDQRPELAPGRFGVGAEEAGDDAEVDPPVLVQADGQGVLGAVGPRRGSALRDNPGRGDRGMTRVEETGAFTARWVSGSTSSSAGSVCAAEVRPLGATAPYSRTNLSGAQRAPLLLAEGGRFWYAYGIFGKLLSVVSGLGLWDLLS